MWLKTAAVRKHSNAQNSGEPQAREPLSHGRRRGRHCNLLVHRPFTRTKRGKREAFKIALGLGQPRCSTGSGGGEREATPPAPPKR